METFEKFKEDILDKVKDCPKEWRKGQSVFNILDEEYGVARYVQFVDNVDCFYDDSKINLFLEKAYNALCTAEKNYESQQ